MDLPKFDPLQLDEKDFIVDLDAQNVCFFPLPIFTRISEMLSPSDFVHLAKTCRYMHWRMFKYGHLMLKRHDIVIYYLEKETKIQETPIEGSPRKCDKMIIPRPYVYVEYLHLHINMLRYSSSIFDDVINYVSTAKKRTKHYCIKIFYSPYSHIRKIFPDINNLIERMKPFHLELFLSWNDYKLSVEIPNIKNVYSIDLCNSRGSRKTDFHMNPCARYIVYAIQDLCDIVQEFLKNSRLQFHICDMLWNRMECFAMLEKEWNLKFEEADTLKNLFCFSELNLVPLYTSIPSEHGNVEIFLLDRTFVVQRKETVIGQWKDFSRNIRR